MAVVDQSAVANHLNQILSPIVTPLFDRQAPMLQVANVSVETVQDQLRWGITNGTNVTADAGIAEGADIDVFDDDTRLKATLAFKRYAKAFQVTGDAMITALQQGVGGLHDLFHAKIVESAEKLVANLSYDMLRGPGTSNRMLGFLSTDGGCRAAGTYAGIIRGTYPLFGATELGNGGVARAIRPELLDDAMTAVFNTAGHGDSPDFILSNAALFDKYAQSFSGKREYFYEVTMAGGRKITLDGGAGAVYHNGVPIIKIKDMPSGEMLIGCSKYMNLKQRPDPAQMITNALGSMTLAGTPEPTYGAASSKVACRIQPLPGYQKGDYYTFALICYPINQIVKPSAFVRLYDLM